MKLDAMDYFIIKVGSKMDKLFKLSDIEDCVSSAINTRKILIDF